jgi:hypothetical protein
MGIVVNSLPTANNNGGKINTMSDVTRSGRDEYASKFMKTKAYLGNHSNPKGKLPARLGDKVQGIEVYQLMRSENESYREPSRNLVGLCAGTKTPNAVNF